MRLKELLETERENQVVRRKDIYDCRKVDSVPLQAIKQSRIHSYTHMSVPLQAITYHTPSQSFNQSANQSNFLVSLTSSPTPNPSPFTLPLSGLARYPETDPRHAATARSAHRRPRGDCQERKIHTTPRTGETNYP